MLFVARSTLTIRWPSRDCRDEDRSCIDPDRPGHQQADGRRQGKAFSHRSHGEIIPFKRGSIAEELHTRRSPTQGIALQNQQGDVQKARQLSGAHYGNCPCFAIMKAQPAPSVSPEPLGLQHASKPRLLGGSTPFPAQSADRAGFVEKIATCEGRHYR